MRAAFSLVELSIVLVILGLLTGGILAGQSLIRAAELRRIGSQITQYQTAMHSFRDKYFAIPGDFANAQQFWGDDTTRCANAQTPDGATCNGNGSGRIASAVGGGGSHNENFYFWEHLQLAGLMEGSYGGAHSATVPYLVPGVNTPQAGPKAIGFNPISYSASAGRPGGIYLTGEGEMLQIGSIHFPNTNSNFYWGVAFTGEEAWNIDSKVDDGSPTTGMLFGSNGATSSVGVNGTVCTSPSVTNTLNAAPANTAYLLNGTGGCVLYARLTR